MRVPLKIELVDEFRREFRDAYGLDTEFREAFGRWGQAGGPERLVPVEPWTFIVRMHVQRSSDADALTVIDAALGNRPLDGEEHAVQTALTGVLCAIDAALSVLQPYHAPRAMRTNPDPSAALMIARDIIKRVPFVERKATPGRRSKQMKSYRFVASLKNFMRPAAGRRARAADRGIGWPPRAGVGSTCAASAVLRGRRRRRHAR